MHIKHIKSKFIFDHFKTKQIFTLFTLRANLKTFIFLMESLVSELYHNANIEDEIQNETIPDNK
jgi:hypothetical protein